MISNKQAKELWMDYTIDLKRIKAEEYLRDNPIKETIFDKFSIIMFYIGCITVCYILIGILTPNISFGANTSIQEGIRQERLAICESEYKKSEINEQFIYKQVPAVRCATYMTLIYAFESDFWKSNKCIEKKNCHWMKWNGRDHPAGFINFGTYTEGREWFANRYWKWHYKKNVNTMIRWWSMTDQDVYVNYVESNYWKVYMELERLYFTQ